MVPVRVAVSGAVVPGSVEGLAEAIRIPNPGLAHEAGESVHLPAEHLPRDRKAAHGDVPIRVNETTHTHGLDAQDARSPLIVSQSE